ncbi:hypothetical protein LCGC14_1518860, partial [marine sediment metagenome]
FKIGDDIIIKEPATDAEKLAIGTVIDLVGTGTYSKLLTVEFLSKDGFPMLCYAHPRDLIVVSPIILKKSFVFMDLD